MDPQPISMVDSPNTYLERLGRLFYSGNNGVNAEGLLLVFVPLIIFAIAFFLIRHYSSSSKKVLLIYAVIVSILYLIYLFALLPKLMYVI